MLLYHVVVVGRLNGSINLTVPRLPVLHSGLCSLSVSLVISNSKDAPGNNFSSHKWMCLHLRVCRILQLG